MTRYIIRRLLLSIPVLLGITMITFSMAELIPGDYVDSLVPREERYKYSAEDFERMRERYGLNKGPVERYFIWIRELALHGNLGRSFTSGNLVLVEMLRRLPATLRLTVGAMAFGMTAGTALGLISAVKQYSWIDNLLTVLGFIWMSTPAFVAALMALYVFSLKVPLFPTSGEGPIGEEFGLGTRLHHLFLPMMILGVGRIPGFMRYARSSLLEVLNQEYITAARAKGLTERAVHLRHALRNALLPLITIVGMGLPGLVGGSFVVEYMFVWPGMAFYSMQSINQTNYPVLMGMNFVISGLVLLSNLFADIAYAWADPRIRYN